MNYELQQLREDAMKRGWVIVEDYEPECRAFVVTIRQVVRGRLIGSRFCYSDDERDYAKFPAEIWRLKFLHMVEEAEAELAKIQ